MIVKISLVVLASYCCGLSQAVDLSEPYAANILQYGVGLTGIFRRYDIDQISSFADVQDLEPIEFFCATPDAINFHEDMLGVGIDPIASYVTNDDFFRFVAQSGISQPVFRERAIDTPYQDSTTFSLADHFTTTFKGFINAVQTESVTVCLNHTGGARMTIGDELLIDQDSPSDTWREACGNVSFLTPGLYAINVDHFNNGPEGGIVAYIDESISVALTEFPTVPAALLIPTSTCDGFEPLYDTSDIPQITESQRFAPPITEPSGNGLSVTFRQYNSTTLSRFEEPAEDPFLAVVAQFRSCVETVNFINSEQIEDPINSYVRNNEFAKNFQDLGISAPLLLETDMPEPPVSYFDVAEMYISNFTGYLNILATGRYQLCIGHDDGARLIVAGVTILDMNYPTGTDYNCETVDFVDPGLYPLQVLHFNNNDQASISFFWNVFPDNVFDRAVPQENLYTFEDCPNIPTVPIPTMAPTVVPAPTVSPTVGNTTLSPTSTPTVTTPTTTPPTIVDPATGSPTFANGDPHFRTFSGHRYDFHGACDLILLHKPASEHTPSIDIHIRTRQRRMFSYIARAAIRIGDDVLEVTANRFKTYYYNGQANTDIDAISMAGYSVTYKELADKKEKQRFTIHLPGTDERILIQTWHEFVAVNIDNPSASTFTGTVGMMGEFGTGRMLARSDASREVVDPNEFGQEWTAKVTDPELFVGKKDRSSGHCRMPDATQKLRRRLGETVMTHEMAELACMQVVADEKDLCVFDVMATGDASMSNMYDQVDASVM